MFYSISLTPKYLGGFAKEFSFVEKQLRSGAGPYLSGGHGDIYPEWPPIFDSFGELPGTNVY